MLLQKLRLSCAIPYNKFFFHRVILRMSTSSPTMKVILRELCRQQLGVGLWSGLRGSCWQLPPTRQGGEDEELTIKWLGKGSARFTAEYACVLTRRPPFLVFRAISATAQERKGHINLRKIPGTPAGCPWDTRRDKQGSTGRCPRDFLLFTIEKRTEKGNFAGTPAGCPRDTRPSRGFSEILCDFFLCAFSAS